MSARPMTAAPTQAPTADPIVIAVDGGGSKTDAVALGLDGTLLTTAHGTGSSPQLIGVDAAVRVDPRRGGDIPSTKGTL